MLLIDFWDSYKTIRYNIELRAMRFGAETHDFWGKSAHENEHDT